MTSLTRDASTIAAELRALVRGEVIERGDTRYEGVREIYNGSITARPALILRGSGVADVVAAVQFALERGLPIAARAGGHGVAGNALIDDGLVVDVRSMKGIRVDRVTSTVRAESGVTWGELDRETAAQGLATTGGFVSTTGIAGLTLGGGLGWLMRTHGLAVDNLISVDLVTADAQVRTASHTQAADLFWGIRGAGANFGIVTALEYRLHPVASSILAGVVTYPFEQAAEVLRHHREFMRKAPDEVSSLVGLLHSPDGTPVAAVLMAAFLPLEEAESALSPLRQFGAPLGDQVAPMAYPELQSMMDEGYPGGLQNYWKSAFLRQLSDEAIDVLVEAYQEATSPLSQIVVGAMAGAVRRVPPEATAFAHRNYPHDVLLLGRWEDPSEAVAHIEWTRTLAGALKPFSGEGAYVNYLSADDASRARTAYGSNFDRLLALKRKYDPDNIFRSNLNLTG